MTYLIQTKQLTHLQEGMINCGSVLPANPSFVYLWGQEDMIVLLNDRQLNN